MVFVINNQIFEPVKYLLPPSASALLLVSTYLTGFCFHDYEEKEMKEMILQHQMRGRREKKLKWSNFTNSQTDEEKKSLYVYKIEYIVILQGQDGFSDKFGNIKPLIGPKTFWTFSWLINYL